MQSIWREVNGFQLIWGQFSIDSSSSNNVHSSRTISGLAQIRPIPFIDLLLPIWHRRCASILPTIKGKSMAESRMEL
jgi:hypothetical protein